MAPWIKRCVRRFGLWLCNIFASDIRDIETGEKIARALMIPWRGRILFIGLEGRPILPRFVPQDHLTYWKQELGFATHPIPDHPNIRGEEGGGGSCC